MGKSSSADERLDIVFVYDGRARAIVPMGGSDRGLASPEGSVTVEGIRRAARRVGEEAHRQSVGAIAQATLRRNCGSEESQVVDLKQ